MQGEDIAQAVVWALSAPDHMEVRAGLCVDSRIVLETLVRGLRCLCETHGILTLCNWWPRCTTCSSAPRNKPNEGRQALRHGARGSANWSLAQRGGELSGKSDGCGCARVLRRSVCGGVASARGHQLSDAFGVVNGG